jgi:hypothetical protein
MLSPTVNTDVVPQPAGTSAAICGGYGVMYGLR